MRTPKIGEAVTIYRYALLGGKRGWSQDTPCPTCYHVKLGTSATKGRIIRRKPQKWGVLWPCHLGVGAWLTPKNKPLLICVTMSIIVDLEWRGYHAEKGVWRYLQPSGYNTRTDGQTDGQMDGLTAIDGHRATAETVLTHSVAR